MTQFFIQLLNASIASSWLIGAVLLVRLIIKGRSPRWIACLLWGLVALRLVIPFSVESPLSLVPETPEITLEFSEEAPSETESIPAPPVSEMGNVSRPTEDSSETEESEPSVPSEDSYEEPSEEPSSEPSEEPDKSEEPEESSEEESLEETSEESIPAGMMGTTSTPGNPSHGSGISFATAASGIWLAGVLALAGYALVNYFLLRQRVLVFVPDERGFRRCEGIDTPFVLGFFRPRIYLPYGLSPASEPYIIAHEKAHIKRMDHLVKPIAYCILALHWFNPLMWIAFVLFCKDIEYACDEKVLENAAADIRKEYATALLECASKRSFLAACPIAFGEVSVKERVKKTMLYKRPLLWVIVVSVLLCALVAVFFFTSPAGEEGENSFLEENEFLGVYEDPAAGIVVLEYTNGGLLKEYSVQGKELILPATYAKGEIVGVADEAFCELESLVSVTIPDGYTYIGASAFRDCPDLETVHIGKDVEEIGVWAFNGCKKLLGLEVSRANVHFYSVKGCLLTKQTNVLLYSSGYMPEETKVIQAGACANKIQTSWKLPAGLQEICSEAFSGGLMEALILPDGVTVIGDKAFAHCKNLKRVYIPATVTKAGQDLFAGIDHELTVYCQAEVQPVDWAANWLQGNDAADVSWGYHSDPLRLQKRSVDNPIQNTHVTPEKLWWYQDCEAYHQTGTSPVYIHVLDMEVFYYVGDHGNAVYDRDADPQCRKAGMKVWVCTPEGEKIDYVYTNSDGVAKFECSPGEYLFLLEKGEFEEKAIGPVTCKQTFSRGSYPYSNSKDYPFPIIAYRGEREDFKVRVIDTETKKPIVGAEVEVQGVGTLTTGEDGYAVFDPLVQFADSWGDTHYLVTCGARGYDERGGEWVQLYDAEFVMELEANAITEYKITILDKKTGKPVEGIKVIEYGNNWHEDSKLFNKVTGEDGTIYGQFTSADLHDGFVRSIRLEYTGEYLLEDGSIVVNKDRGEIRLEKGKTEYILYLERHVRDATLREKKD